MLTNCLIAWGANIPGPYGNPSETHKAVLKELELAEFIILKKSRLYASVAFPDPQMPQYLNGCLELKIDCKASDLLSFLKLIETKMGRQQNARWGSRTCDLDLLNFDNQVCPSWKTFNYWYKLPFEKQLIKKPNELLLPHPRIQDRAFVLKPLMEVAASWVHPVLNLTTKEMFNAIPCEERDKVISI